MYNVGMNAKHHTDERTEMPMSEDQITGRIQELMTACRLQGAMMVDKIVDQDTKDQLRAEVDELKFSLIYDLVNYDV